MSEHKNPCIFCGRTDDADHLFPRETMRERLARVLLGVQPSHIVICNPTVRPTQPLYMEIP